MAGRAMARAIVFAGLLQFFPLLACAAAGQASEPIVYTLTVSAPETHTAEVQALVPTEGQRSIELMMPVWTPGFYRIEDYAGQVEAFSAQTLEGETIAVEHPQKNRWRIETTGATRVRVSYRLSCRGRSVTTNWVGEDFGVFNGAATFATLAEAPGRPHEIRLRLPAQWKRSISGLPAAPGGAANHYRAEDFDNLVDSPIVAGDPFVHEFDVDGSKHIVVDLGDVGEWDTRRAVCDLEKIVGENRNFWGSLPFKRYVFLNVFGPGGGGLEHRDCTLLTTRPPRGDRGQPSVRWLEFVSHEYFHAFNVKRLRPIELGPFDYEHPPKTSSLWISEGLTSYYGELMVARAGVGGRDDFLASLSSHIGQLQNSPGRLVQTLEQSSLDVWTSGFSGIGRNNAETVSYYVKGPVVGFLLDARIRERSNGQKSLDDVMRLAYARYSGNRGFTAEQFRAAAEEVARDDLKGWFHRALASTEELEYSEALDWFGLRFAAADDAAKAWHLEVRPDASDAQKRHLADLLAPAQGR